MNDTEKIISKIKEILTESYHNLDDYIIGDSIKEIVEYFGRFNSAEHPVYWLTYREHTQVNNWNNIRDQIRADIIENDYRVYDYKEDKDKDNYTRGVLAAIHLIEHRVHCICDI